MFVAMTATLPRFTKEEFARRGAEIYRRDIEKTLPVSEVGKFVAIDIESGAWQIDADDFTATEHLLQFIPQAQIWLLRVGSPTTYRRNVNRTVEVQKNHD
jgi:hypothetical protein